MDKVLLITKNTENDSDIDKELDLLADDIVTIDISEVKDPGFSNNLNCDLLVFNIDYFSDDISEICRRVRKKYSLLSILMKCSPFIDLIIM